MNQDDRKELIFYRITKAKEIFAEIDLHLKNELWNTAVNRLYYACFYAVSALLLKNNISAKTHAGARLMLGMHFIKTGIISKEFGKFYSDLFDLRQTGDYEDFKDNKKEDVIDLIEPAKKLISEIEKLIVK
ncbi:MAG: hypothetical protein A2046_15605 [Bacteroidetes bacterium GWA2_30_7]|nr:MAG: hypothetical protein A2046_15605 [Bacteroidetes bacterium GWA2_30_7]